MFAGYRIPLFLLAVSLSGAALLPAQMVTGNISGRVTDSSGAVIGGASVQVQNVETGLTRSVDTDVAGRYTVSNLPSGSYTVTTQKQGFRTQVRRGVTLAVGSEATLNFEMPVGEVAEKVEVTAEAPAVETSTATLSGLVNPAQIRDLPLNGRSVDQLALLTPGVVNETQVSRTTVLEGMGMRLVINGARTNQVLYLLDGSVSSDYSQHGPGGAAAESLGVEAIREFRLLTHSFSAEYGRNSIGGVFSAITRSGTNDLHGSAYEFVRNNIFDARNFFNKGALPPFRRNQFGASVGGRVVRDKIFFFANYEGLRQRQALPLVSFVPDDNARLGILPTGRVNINPAVQPYLNLFPRANGPVLGGGIATFNRDATIATTENYSMGRMDFRLSDKDSLYARFLDDPSDSVIPTAFDPFFNENLVTYQLSTLSETHIFSPTSLNEFRFSFNRTFPRSTTGPLVIQNHALDFVPGAGFGQLNFTGTAVPGSSLSSLTPLGNGGTLPKLMYQNLFQATETFSHVHGTHSFKFGVDVERLQANINGNVFPQQRGVYAFPSLASFLAGQPSQVAFPIIGGDSNPERGWRQTILGWFVEDDIRVRPNLTLNLGLRHEFVTAPVEVNGKMASLATLTSATSTIGSPFPTKKANFAPRFGLAWDPTGSGKTSIRAGTGVFYDLPIMQSIWDTSVFDYRFATTYSVNNPPNFPNALLSGFGPGLVATRGVQQDLGTATSIHYNLEVQRQLSSTVTVNVGFVGSHNYHLVQGPQANRAIPQILPDGSKFFCPASAAVSPPCPANAPQLPLLNPNFSTIQWASAPGWSHYNALQAGFQKTLSFGLQLQAGYTWSKNMSSVDAQIGTEVVGQVVGPMDLQDLARDYSLSLFNQAHVFNANGKYKMPWDHLLQSGVAKAALGGWEINSIWRATSGLAHIIPVGFNVSRSRDPLSSDRPNLNPGFSNNPTSGTTAGCPGVPAGQQLGTPNLYFDPCAFSIPAAGTFGNLGRDTLIGPGLFNVDFGVVKNTPLRERMALEFRAEFFNLFNHANFQQPATALFLASGARNTIAGQITATAVDNREIQFGMKLTF